MPIGPGSGGRRLDVRAGGSVEPGGDALTAFLVDHLTLLGVTRRLSRAQFAGKDLTRLIKGHGPGAEGSQAGDHRCSCTDQREPHRDRSIPRTLDPPLPAGAAGARGLESWVQSGRQRNNQAPVDSSVWRDAYGSWQPGGGSPCFGNPETCNQTGHCLRAGPDTNGEGVGCRGGSLAVRPLRMGSGAGRALRRRLFLWCLSSGWSKPEPCSHCYSGAPSSVAFAVHWRSRISCQPGCNVS